MKHLYERTWFEDDNGVRFFLLVGSEKALVIDTGMTGVDVRSLVSEHTSLPCELLNTHSDRDHIGSNHQFTELYIHPSEAAIYRNNEHGTGKLIPVFEGDQIDLGGRILEIVHLPGHTPGSITVLDKDHRCLIGGDPIQENGDIFMFGDHSNMEAYIASLERLVQRTDFDYVYPSHGEKKVGRGTIFKLIEDARNILAGKLEGIEIEVFGHKAKCYDTGTARFLCR